MNELAASRLITTHRRALIRAWHQAKQTSQDLLAVLRIREDSASLDVHDRRDALKKFPAGTFPVVVQSPAQEAGPLPRGSSLWVVVVQTGVGAACLRWTEPYLEEEYLLMEMSR